MAHELRNPLTAVICWAELLRDTQLSREQGDMLGIMQRSAQSLVGIINNVLDLARLDVGRLELDARPFDLRASIEESLDLLSAAAAQKGVELASVVDDATPARLSGDAARVRQVLVNLLGNAVKFTQRGHVVASLTSRRLADGRYEAHIAVRDTGPGIPADRLEAVFGEFVQGDAATAARHGGSGLGLAIARRLAAMMGGRIWAESEPRAGSTFHFTLTAPAATGGPPLLEPHPVLRGKQVAIVHDNAAVGRILAGQIERWDAHGWVTTRPAAAVERLRAGEPCDLMLIDQHIAGMGGRSLAAAVRRVPAAAHVPLVLLTSLDPADRDGAAANDAVRFAGYVAKPVKAARLHETLVAAFTAPVAATPAPPAAPPRARNTRLAGTTVLVADDDVGARSALERMLREAGARVTSVGDGAAALDTIATGDPDVVLLDGEMPQRNGFDVCRQLKDNPATRLVPVVLVTGLSGDAARLRGIEARADDVVCKPFHPAEVVARVQALADLKRFTDGLDRVESVLVTMARCVEGRDPATHGHCERLADYASRLGQRLGLDAADVNALRLGGIVHDIGKVAVPDAVLYKPGALTAAEWAVMQRHPVEGERICAGLTAFRRVLPIIRHHHERMDGSGYPDGLRGDEIPFTARVLQMVDVYDALRSRRPYKRAVSARRALDILGHEVARGWRDAQVYAAWREQVLEDGGKSGATPRG
jgi:putative two-component system response regulator